MVRPGACGETLRAAPTSQNSRLRHTPDSYTPSWGLDPTRWRPHQNLLNGRGRNGWKPPRPESVSREPVAHAGLSADAICRRDMAWGRRSAVNAARLGVISSQRKRNSTRDLADCCRTEAVTSGHRASPSSATRRWCDSRKNTLASLLLLALALPTQGLPSVM